jgi:hypothetical protein
MLVFDVEEKVEANDENALQEIVEIVVENAQMMSLRDDVGFSPKTTR